MKTLTIALFAVGLVWAYACFAFLALPFTGLWSVLFSEETYDLPFRFFGFLFLLFLNSAVGYWIWLGWLTKFWKDRYFGVSESAFWKYSIINHLAWILLLPILFGAMTIGEENEFAFVRAWITGIYAWPYLLWPAGVGVISLVIACRKTGKRTGPSENGNGLRRATS